MKASPASSCIFVDLKAMQSGASEICGDTPPWSFWSGPGKLE